MRNDFEIDVNALEIEMGVRARIGSMMIKDSLSEIESERARP